MVKLVMLVRSHVDNFEERNSSEGNSALIEGTERTKPTFKDKEDIF